MKSSLFSQPPLRWQCGTLPISGKKDASPHVCVCSRSPEASEEDLPLADSSLRSKTGLCPHSLRE